jgi:hypothetical protein
MANLPEGPRLERVQRYLTFLLETRLESVEKLPTIGEAWPPGLEFARVAWRSRTRNCLVRQGLDRRVTEVPFLTFGDLIKIPAMGITSLLDFVCTLEAAMAYFLEPSNREMEGRGEEESASDVLLEALEEPWAYWVSEKDPRFADVLPDGSGTIGDRIDQLTSSPNAPPEMLLGLAKAVSLIRGRISALEEEGLDSALARFVGGVAGVKGPRLEALAGRLNVDGGPAQCTLDEAGKRVGLTRERIRQLQSRFNLRKPDHPVVMPALDRALALLSLQVPLSAEEATGILLQERISSRPFHPSSLISAAVICGRAPSIRVEQVLGKEMVVVSGLGKLAEQVLRIAHRQAAACGASNVSQVIAELAKPVDGEVSEDAICEILVEFSDVEFLEGPWFWFPQRATDAIRDISRKILSVTAPVSVGVLREGIRRALRFRQSSARRKGRVLVVPPRSVLLAYYHVHLDFVVLDGDMVKSVRPLDYRNEIRGVERVLVEVLQSTPTRVMDHTSFAEGCTERGVNPSTLRTMATYSPVVEHLATGLLTLRGTQVDPASVEAIRQANAVRPRERRVVDFGWLSDGRLWIAFRLPADIESQVFGIPGAVKRFIAGQDFEGLAEDGSSCGRIRVYDYGISAGYGTFLKRAGADEGDVLMAKFDLVRRSVELSLTDDEELEGITSASDSSAPFYVGESAKSLHLEDTPS